MNNIFSWEPEGPYHYSKMFHWEPEECYRHELCTAIASFWFSTEHLWILIAPFWLSTEYDSIRTMWLFSTSWNPWSHLENCMRFFIFFYTKLMSSNIGLCMVSLGKNKKNQWALSRLMPSSLTQSCTCTTLLQLQQITSRLVWFTSVSTTVKPRPEAHIWTWSFWSVFEEHRLDSTTTDITTALFIL